MGGSGQRHFRPPMSGRATTLLIDRLRALAARKGHFCYDVIGDSHVYDGIVAPYRVEADDVELHELQPVLEHALQHDGMVTGRKDPATGKVRWSSGRHFTDIGNALHHLGEVRRRHHAAGPFAILRVVRELNGIEGPDVDAEAAHREFRSAVASMSKNNVGLNGEDVLHFMLTKP